MKWFEDTFLTSFIPRMKNKKYPNQAILTEAQYNICYRYMKQAKHGLAYESSRFSVIVWKNGHYNFIRVLKK